MVLLIVMLLTAAPVKLTESDIKRDAENRAFVKKTLNQCKRSGCNKCGRFYYEAPELVVPWVRYEPTHCEIEHYRLEAAYNVQVQDEEIRDRYERKP